MVEFSREDLSTSAVGEVVQRGRGPGQDFYVPSVLPGEDERAGRWSGFAKKECGLHTSE